jgi:uncharacterized protein involved in propanediol utilization
MTRKELQGIMSEDSAGLPLFTRPTAEAGVSIGHGKSFGSFGEIVQGRTGDGEDFLVTLPINMWNTCHLVCRQIPGPLVIECNFAKSRQVIQYLLAAIGIDRGYHLTATFTQELPTGKGLSSSTADMLAAARAIQETFGVIFAHAFLSEIFARVEPHDAVHYDTCVLYNHRRGRLIEVFGYVPQFWILGVDAGGIIDTVAYNKRLNFSAADLAEYDRLKTRVSKAFENSDDDEIANCAYRSTLLHAERTSNAFLFDVMRVAQNMKSLGVVNTHSGTCAGLLYPPELGQEQIAAHVAELRSRFNKHVFVTRTIRFVT